jgi:hypothetical protein
MVDRYFKLEFPINPRSRLVREVTAISYMIRLDGGKSTLCLRTISASRADESIEFMEIGGGFYPV